MVSQENVCISCAYHRAPSQRGQYSSPSPNLSSDSLLSIGRDHGMCASPRGPWHMQLPSPCSRDRVTYLSSERQTASRVRAHSPGRPHILRLCGWPPAHRPRLSRGLSTPHPHGPREPHSVPSRKTSPRMDLLTTPFLQPPSCLLSFISGPRDSGSSAALLPSPAH